MKNITLTVLSLLLAIAAIAQKTIEKPKHGLSTASYLKIQDIELTDTATVLSFKISDMKGFRFTIPKNTFIQPVNGNEKLNIKATEGVPLGKGHKITESGEISYKLIFPPIASNVEKIDYKEQEGNWAIYDIEIISSPGSDLIPESLTGNWFNTENGKWEVSFFDKHAVYKSKVWNYNTVKLKKGKGSVQLQSEGNTQELFIKKTKNGNFLIGESSNSLVAYSKDKPKVSAVQANNDEPYKMPIFKRDTATYSGYIKGYTPRTGVKTMRISVNDIITGEQNSHLIKIAENGYFSAKIPVYYPSAAFVRSKLFNGTIYLEPGKDLFQMIAAGEGKASKWCMGESAEITFALNRFNNFDLVEYNKIRKQILDLTPEKYKERCLKLQKEAFEELDSFKESGIIGTKAYQVIKLDIEYRYPNKIMEYRWTYESAYRKKHKIPRKQRTLPVKIETPKADFYDFITDEMVNNPLAVVSPSYRTFINRVKYLQILRETSIGYTHSDIIRELKKSGYSFTEDEKELVKKLEEIEELQKQAGQKDFWAKYRKLSSELFNNKYRDVLQEQRKEMKNMNILYSDLKSRLDKKNTEYTNEEKQFWKELLAIESTEEVKKLNQIREDIREDSGKFFTKHKSLTQGLFSKSRQTSRLENLKNKLGVQPGFASDIMAAQDECRSIVSEMTPVSEEQLKEIQQQIGTPFIAEYIAHCNVLTKVKIQENKLKTGYTVNRTPKTDGDKLFDAMMEKFKGKVVFVDFWATWCGPCRSGIERVKPLKEEMKDEEDVVFVYITNNTSPQKTWSNMIADIKGEHFRVSSDEWNYLSNKFNISGIPHYVMVDKNGKVDNNVGKLRNLASNKERLKQELEKKMKE